MVLIHLPNAIGTPTMASEGPKGIPEQRIPLLDIFDLVVAKGELFSFVYPSANVYRTDNYNGNGRRKRERRKKSSIIKNRWVSKERNYV